MNLEQNKNKKKLRSESKQVTPHDKIGQTDSSNGADTEYTADTIEAVAWHDPVSIPFSSSAGKL